MKQNEKNKPDKPVVQADNTPDTQRDDTKTEHIENKENAAQEQTAPPIKKRRLPYGTVATGITALVVVAVVIFNVIFSILAERIPALSLDLTANQSYTLKKQSIEAANAVTLDTEILLIGSPDTFAPDVYAQVPQLAARYAAVSGKITYRYVDLQQNPSFASAYPQEELQAADVILRTEKRYRHIKMEDMILYDEQTGAVTSEVESTLTTAIMAVNSDKLPIVGILEGHNEAADLSGLESLLNANNFECRTLNLMTDDVDNQADILVLGSPVNDLTGAEIKKLDSYLENGQKYGKSLLITYDTTQPETPNLDLFLKDWGIRVSRDYIAETDSDRLPPLSTGYELYAGVNTGAADFAHITAPCLVGYLRHMEILDTTETYMVTPLAMTYDSTISIPVDATEESFDEQNAKKEAHNVFVVSEQDKRETGAPRNSSVAVAASSDFFYPSWFGTSSLGNQDVTLTYFRWATGADDLEETVNITPISLIVYDLAAMTASTSSLVGIVIFTVLLPMLVLAIGLFVYLKRRHL